MAGLKRLLFNVGTGQLLFLDLRPDLVGYFGADDDGLMFLVVECKPRSSGSNREDAYVCCSHLLVFASAMLFL